MKFCVDSKNWKFLACEINDAYHLGYHNLDINSKSIYLVICHISAVTVSAGILSWYVVKY